jgi:cytochrome c oxidase cbb3-type subunit 4
MYGLWIVWGIGLFLGICVWAFYPSNKDRFYSDAQIPFKDL